MARSSAPSTGPRGEKGRRRRLQRWLPELWERPKILRPTVWRKIFDREIFWRGLVKTPSSSTSDIADALNLKHPAAARVKQASSDDLFVETERLIDLLAFVETILDALPRDAASRLGAALCGLPLEAAARPLDATLNRDLFCPTASWSFGGAVVCTERFKTELKEI